MRKNLFFSLAAAAMLAAGFMSCAEDNAVIDFNEEAPEPDPTYVIDYSQQEAYPYYRMGEPSGSSYNVVDGALLISNTVEQANNWDLQPFVIDWMNLQEGYDYKVRITMASTAAGNANLTMGTWSASMNKSFDFAASEGFEQYDILFSASTVASSGNDVHILFQMGKTVADVKIQKVEVWEIAPAGPIEVPEVDPTQQPLISMDYAQQASYPYYRMGEPEGSSFDVVDGVLVINNTVQQESIWSLQPFIIDWFSVQEGYNYIVRIKMSASAAGSANIVVGTWSASMTKTLNFDASNDFVDYDVTFSNASFASSNNDVHALFQMGSSISEVKIQKVEVYEVAP